MCDAKQNCRYCDRPISSAAVVCPECGSSLRTRVTEVVGKTVPLVASTVSTLLLVGALVWPMYFPERARIHVETASPAYALDALRLDISNLSDLAVPLPSELHCDHRGEFDHLVRRFGTATKAEDGSAHTVLTLTRDPDSAPGFRNASARVRYAVNGGERWGVTGTRGRLDCVLQLRDVHGELDPIMRRVAFEIAEGGVILYDIHDFQGADAMDIDAGLFYAPRNELFRTSK